MRYTNLVWFLFACLIGNVSAASAQETTATEVPAFTAAPNADHANSLTEVSLRDLRRQAAREDSVETAAAIEELKRRALIDTEAADALAGIFLAKANENPEYLASAITYFEVVAEAGSTRANRRLGDIYREDGPLQDLALSFANYKIAADAGDLQSAYRVAEFLRTGSGIPRDRAAALPYYEVAANGGNKWARFRLARGLLDETLAVGRAEEGFALLEEVAAEGMEGAVAALGEAHVRGNGTDRNVEKGLGILTAAASDGDVASAQVLIRYYTEGRVAGIPRSLAKAEQTLAALRNTDDARAILFETVIFGAASATNQADYAAVTDNFSRLSASAKRSAISRIFGLNRNLYVYALQVTLAEQGMYSGALNGLLTSTTIRAINELCAAKDVTDVCRQGPLSSLGRRAVIAAAYS